MGEPGQESDQVDQLSCGAADLPVGDQGSTDEHSLTCGIFAIASIAEGWCIDLKLVYRLERFCSGGVCKLICFTDGPWVREWLV